MSNPIGEWEWKDKNKFSKTQKVGFYSKEKVSEVYNEGEKAVRLITSERRSLYEEWKNWQANPEWDIPKLSPLWDEVNLNEHNLQNKV